MWRSLPVLLLLAAAIPSIEGLSGSAHAQPGAIERTALDGFAIDTTEVTVGRFGRTVSPGDGSTMAEQSGGGFEYAAGWEQRPGWVWHAPYGKPAAPMEPAVHITWFEAADYCRSAGGSLPTWTQWRQAAYVEGRGRPTDGFEQGRQYRYPVGDDPLGMNTSAPDPWPRHAPAGVTRRGVNGLYDMGANVWEWLADVDGDQALTAGGSWWYGPERTRADAAQYKPRDFAAVYIGFRCVYPP